MGALRRSDVGLPLLLGAVATLEVLWFDGEGRFAALALELGACALLVARRFAPIVIAPVAVALVNASWLVGPAMDDLAAPLLIIVSAVYALARWIPDLRGLVGVGAILGLAVLAYLTIDERTHDVTDVVFVAAFLLPPYAFGRITRRLASQSEQLRQQQELIKQAAVRDERDRIARELHDVIAHSVSAMVVQVAAAQDLVRQNPEKAERILGRVADTGRKAIAETGRLLHVIRDTGDELGLAPTPGVDDLEQLVREFREDGLAVELVAEGLPDDLPAAVDVSVYRVVREALTNALRYSADRTVRVELLGTATGLTVRATNPSGGDGAAGSGLGLPGLRERVDLLGGTLRHGRAGDTYELVALLPLESREPV